MKYITITIPWIGNPLHYKCRKQVANRCGEFKWEYKLISTEIKMNPLTENDSCISVLKVHDIGAIKRDNDYSQAKQWQAKVDQVWSI